MSRTLSRSGGPLQTEPDVLIDRRTTKQAAIGVPFAKAELAGLPTYMLEGEGSFYPHVEAKLHVPSEKSGRQPRLELDQKVFVRESENGPAIGYKIVSLFTHTTKMATISWSLAAGSPFSGGTCHAARAMPFWASRPADYICASCYALEGNYRYQNNIFFRALRRQWMADLLRQDATGLAFADVMTEVIDAYARFSTQPDERRKDSAWTVREGMEIGIWGGDRLLVPKRSWRTTQNASGASKRAMTLEYIPGVPTTLNRQNGSTTNDWYLDLARRNVVQKDDVVGLFRLHDSGDFSMDVKKELWPSYIQAWKIVFSRFPGVLFWSPTRLHYPKVGPVLGHLVRLQKESDNLILRPSALFVDNPSPILAGMAAGSTVERREGAANSRAVDEKGASCWACPAYPGGSHRAEGSCRDHHCRTCWLEKDVPIAYGHH